MKGLIHVLIIIAAVVLIVGAVLAFGRWTLIKPALTYWRGGVALLLFAISLMLLKMMGTKEK